MRKLFALTAALLLLICLCACGEGPSPAPTITAAPTVTALCPTPEPDPSKEKLMAILADIQQNYQPGTAGSSLSAARLAGRLLDWNAAAKWDPAAITASSKAFYEGLNPEAASLFVTEQLPGIYDGAQGILGSSGKDLLEAAGYDPVYYPWSKADAKTLFAALYEGVGLTPPK